MPSTPSGERVTPALFGLPRLATAFLNTALLTLSLPVVVREAVGDRAKGFHLGLITGLAALFGLAVLAAAGSWIDRHAGSRSRKRCLLTALGLTLPPLGVLSVEAGYPLEVAAFIALSGARSFCDASHLPLLADRIAAGRRETLSSAVAFYHFLGSGAGALAFALLPHPPVAVAVVIVLLAAAGFHAGYRPEAPSRPPGAAPAMALPPDYLHLLVARTFFLGGLLIVTSFLVFFVGDVLKAEDVRRTTAVLYAASLAGALGFAVPAGRLSQRLGEVPVLLAAGAAVGVAAPVFVVTGRDYPMLVMVTMVVYGIGFAAVVASGISLSVRLVPHPALAGRLLSLATASTFISQLLASTSGALVIDPLNRIGTNLGYYALVGLIEIYFLVAAFFLLRIGRKSPLSALAF